MSVTIKMILASFLLAWTCTTCSAGAHTYDCASTTDMFGQSEVIATVVSNSSLKAHGPETDVEAIAAAAMGMYDRAAAEQAVPTAAQLKAMDRAFQDAENKVNLVAPLKYQRTLQLRKLLADVLDRLIWGGSLLVAGIGLSSLATRFKRRSRVLTSVSMVLLGCSYALLLPIIAVGVVVAWLFFRRTFNATLISSSTADSAHGRPAKVVVCALP
ncbi:MAG TPA: hypothetical protein V6C69_16860 [Trichormus sp.]|jgi:hypothetical protein